MRTTQRFIVATPSGFVALGKVPVRAGYFVAQTKADAYACSQEQAELIAKKLNRSYGSADFAKVKKA